MSYDAWKTRSDLDDAPQPEPDEESGEGRCIECGGECPAEDQICGYCAAANRDTENSVNEQRDI
jgi:hypothetical protein